MRKNRHEGVSPHDTFTGYGYARSSEPRGLGISYLSSGEFPYLSDGEETEEQENDVEPVTGRKLGNHTYVAHDPVGMSKGTDRFSMSNVRHNVSEADSIVPFPDLYDSMDTGSPVGGMGTRVDQSPWTGSSRAAAGYFPLDADDDMPNYDLDDIINDDDVRAIRRNSKAHAELVEMFTRL